MQDDNFVVVKNQEEQYSIWPALRAIPAGWQAEPMRGSKELCLKYIGAEWTDLRPASLKRAMAQ